MKTKSAPPVPHLGCKLLKVLMGGAQGQNRTADTRIFSPLLYQLSYLGAKGPGGYRGARRSCPETLARHRIDRSRGGQHSDGSTWRMTFPVLALAAISS